jgi:hypothetical protein
MTSTKQKGQQKELLAEKMLKEMGYKVFFRSFTVKRGPCWVGLDFADQFDLVASNGWDWRLISCKHVKNAGTGREETKEAIRKFAEEHGKKDMRFELWIWNPSKYTGRGKEKKWVDAHFRKFQLEEGGNEWTEILD